MLFKDIKTADINLKCNTGLECKQTATNIVNYFTEEWNSKAKEL